MNNENLIAVGIFSFVYRINASRVRKVPRDSESDNMQAIRNEANIYALLGDHNRIAKCPSAGQTEDYVELEWAQYGDLETFISEHVITDLFRLRLTRQIIEAVAYIHYQGVIHSDLCLRQFLLYEDYNLRLSDFAASGYQGHDALGMEAASHYMPRDPEQPNDVKSDLFALGCTLYELIVGQSPYHGKEDKEIQSLYEQEKFPQTGGLFGGNIILGCWKRHFDTADDVLRSYDAILEKKAQVALGPRSIASLMLA